MGQVRLCSRRKFLGIRHPGLMSEREVEKVGLMLLRYTWNEQDTLDHKRTLLLDHVAVNVLKMPVLLVSDMMWDLYLWSEMCKTLNFFPRTTDDWKEYVVRVSTYDATSHTWTSVHSHLCTGESTKLKPSQLNMHSAT